MMFRGEQAIQYLETLGWLRFPIMTVKLPRGLRPFLGEGASFRAIWTGELAASSHNPVIDRSHAVDECSAMRLPSESTIRAQ